MIRLKEFIVTMCPAFSFALFLAASAVAQPLDGWKLLWSDEFNDTSLDGSKWQLELNEGDHGMSAYTNRPQNLYVADGCLVLQAQKENYSGKSYTSTQVSSRNKGHWKYGRFDIRAKLPYGKGMWPAIWMMPNNPAYGGWPRSGEIDIMENLGDSKLYATLHYGTTNAMSQGIYTTPAGQSPSDTFHVYTMIWDTNSFAFYIDSVHNFWNCDTWSPNNTTYPKPFDQTFFMMFDLAIGGSWGGPPDNSTVFPQKMLVDWIRVYQRQNPVEIRQPAVNHSPMDYSLTVTKKWVELNLKTGTPVSLTLYDLAGREVVRLTDGRRAGERIRFPVSATLTHGSYLWKLATAGRPDISGKIPVQ